MNKKYRIACAFIILVGIYSAAFADGSRVITLTIVHLNDNESQLLNAGKGMENFGGAARAVTVIKNIRSTATTDAVLTLSAGDNFLIGPEFKASLAAFNPALGGVNTYYDAKTLDAISYDAIVPGNHDFDLGPDFLKDFISFGFSKTVPPFLCANIKFTGEPALQKLVENGRLAKRIIINKKKHHFGIIGVTTPNLTFISSPGSVAVEADLVTVVQNEINWLLGKGINKIILVGHLQDLADDKALIAQLNGVDIAVAGGSNTVLANPGDNLLPGDTSGGAYPVLVKDLSGRKVPIVTTGGEYRYVGRLVVEFDAATGEITRINPTSGPIRVAGGTNPDAVIPDPEVLVQVTVPVQAYLDTLETNVIAQSGVALDGIRQHVRSRETNLGNLVADSLLSEAQRLTGKFDIKRAAVALTNAGGIRNNVNIPVGKITERDTYDIAPFANFLVVFENVPVKTFKNLLENAVSQIDNKGNPAGSGTGRFAQVAGFSFEYDPSRQAIAIAKNGRILIPGERITRVVLDDKTKLIDAGIIMVDPAYTLAIATTDFLARGGDQYPFGALPYANLYITYQEALSNYMRRGLGGVIKKVSYPEGGQGRIIRRRGEHSF